MTRRSSTARSRRATCCSSQSRSSPIPSSSIGTSSPTSLHRIATHILHPSLHPSLHPLRHRSRHRSRRHSRHRSRNPSLHHFTRCKLTDLGIPELQRHIRLSGLSGSTLRYLAPEVLSKQPQDDKVDVWALGCILYEMATFSHAFSSTSAIQRGAFARLQPKPKAQF